MAALIAIGCAEDEPPDAAGSDVGVTSPDATVAAVRAAFERRANDPRLDPTLGSLVFVPETTYGQALLELTLIQAGVKETTTARMGAPLPDGAVLGLPGPAQQDLRISLAAPEGYDVSSRRPLVNPMRVPAPSADARVSAAGPWPVGSALPVPVLPGCMVSQGGDPPAVTCAPDDVVQIRADSEVPLP